LVGHELPEGAGFGALADQAADEALDRLARGGPVVDGHLELLAADPDGVGILPERDPAVMTGAVAAIGRPAPGADLIQSRLAALSVVVLHSFEMAAGGQLRNRSVLQLVVSTVCFVAPTLAPV
jgi:hypothetical protein